MRKLTDLPKTDIYSFADVQKNDEILIDDVLWQDTYSHLPQKQEIQRRANELNCDPRFTQGLIGVENAPPKNALILTFIPKRALAVGRVESKNANK